MEHLATFKNKLELERAQLVTLLTSLAIHNQETDDWEIKTDTAVLAESDESLLADAAEESEADVSQLSELENQYRHVQIALGKIAAGTYGACELGGEEIDTVRLNANPSARTCLKHMNDEAQLPL